MGAKLKDSGLHLGKVSGPGEDNLHTLNCECGWSPKRRFPTTHEAWEKHSEHRAKTKAAAAKRAKAAV